MKGGLGSHAARLSFVMHMVNTNMAVFCECYVSQVVVMMSV